MSYYAVAVGRKCGVYQTWAECKEQVDGYSGARYKKFLTPQEAEKFCETNSINGCNSDKAVLITAQQQNQSSPKINQEGKKISFYAVAVGRKCGVYQTWSECKAQVDGYVGACYKKFSTLEEAEKFCQTNSINDSNSGNTSGSRKRKQPDDCATSSHSSRGRPGWVAAGSRPDYSDTVIVYTDGACENNGYLRAKAGIGVYWGENHPDNVAEPLRGRQTNNRAEIQAVVTAIQQAKQRGYRSVTVRTDSKFLLDSITNWVHKWKKNDWTLFTGGPVRNKEDFQDLLRAMNGIDVRWEKVRAHRGILGNERADQLARQGKGKNRI